MVGLHTAFSTSYLLLGGAVFLLTFRSHLHLTVTAAGVARHVFAGWLAISSLLLAFALITGTLAHFDLTLLAIWWFVAPLSQFAAQMMLRFSKPIVARLLTPPKRAVVVGVNEQGIELARRMDERSMHVHMVGYFCTSTFFAFEPAA